MNASFYPELMQELQIESVPCLLVKVDGEIKEKVYTFKSAQNILQYLAMHNQEEKLFAFKWESSFLEPITEYFKNTKQL